MHSRAKSPFLVRARRVPHEYLDDHLGWSPTLSTERDGVVAGVAVDSILGGGAGLAAPQRLVEATDEGRSGSTSASAGLLLEVPVDTEAGTYTGAITVSLFPVD